ncbi:unnamed protein product [Ilex paraguariensis]|uniref:Uncharacterized protein n=1 Tax=Ilex paraguariensis TaxID=185542 RepID=A0ABC8U6G3_9AQUA
MSLASKESEVANLVAAVDTAKFEKIRAEEETIKLRAEVEEASKEWLARSGWIWEMPFRASMLPSRTSRGKPRRNFLHWILTPSCRFFWKGQREKEPRSQPRMLLCHRRLKNHKARLAHAAKNVCAPSEVGNNPHQQGGPDSSESPVEDICFPLATRGTRQSGIGESTSKTDATEHSASEHTELVDITPIQCEPGQYVCCACEWPRRRNWKGKFGGTLLTLSPTDGLGFHAGVKPRAPHVAASVNFSECVHLEGKGFWLTTIR